MCERVRRSDGERERVVGMKKQTKEGLGNRWSDSESAIECQKKKKNNCIEVVK